MINTDLQRLPLFVVLLVKAGFITFFKYNFWRLLNNLNIHEGVSELKSMGYCDLYLLLDKIDQCVWFWIYEILWINYLIFSVYARKILIMVKDRWQQQKTDELIYECILYSVYSIHHLFATFIKDNSFHTCFDMWANQLLSSFKLLKMIREICEWVERRGY